MGTLSGCIRKAGKALNKPDADAIRQMRNELLEDGLSAQDAAAESLALYIEELKADYQAVYDQVGIEAPPFDPKALANYRGTVPSSSDMLRSKVDDLVQKFEAQEGVSENISAYNVTGLDETADTLAYGPKEKEAFIRFLQERGDANEVLDRLSELSNTPWAKQAVQGALARMAMKDLIAGREVDYQNPVSYKGGALEQNLKLAGEDGMWAYLMGYNIRKLASGKLSSRKAPRQGMIGHPEKPVNAVNGSFIDCNPSKACATYCYATKGRYNYASSTIRSELVTLAAELDADRFAEMVSNEYKAMPEFHVKKALRFFDKGDMAEQHLAVLEGLRKEGVRAQIFTKQPELLRQVNDFHLKMLSIDETNFDMAEQNPDLNVALVYDGSKQMTDWALDNLDRISVILPIKIGQRLLTSDELARLNKNKQAKSLLCPIDNGKKKLGEWDCTRCDARGGMGCFHGSVTEKVLKAATLGVKQEEEIKVLLEEVKDAASQLDEASRAELLGNLESLVSKIRTGDDTLAESESTEQFDGIADRERGIYEGDAEQTEQLELFDAEGDVYADLETRPGTTEDQRSTGRDALSDLSGLLNRYAGSRWGSRGDDGSAVAILGARIFKDFKAGKPSQLIGDEISSPGDLAVLAQVYRDPRFETFRIFYTKGDKVIGEEATSSRLPGSVKFNNTDMADTIRARMTALGADGYWMAHNHPTGRGQPSKGDRFATRQIAQEAPGFKGHVVIDFNEYGSIQANGDAKVVSAPELAGTDFMAKPTKDHPWLGMPVGSTAQAGMAARALATEDRAVILSINHAGDVQMISSADMDYLTDMVRDGLNDKNKMRKARALATLRRVSAASGSGSHMVVILPKGFSLQEHSYLQGFAADVVSAEGQSLVETNGRVGLYVSNILGDVVGDGFLRDEQTGYQAARFDEGFYTKLEKLIADAKIPGLVPSKRNPAGAARSRDWFAYLRARDVSNEEWEASGLRDVLREGSKDRYTRDELLALAAERRYQYTPETVILGNDGTQDAEPGQLWMEENRLTGEEAAKLIAEVDMDGYWAGDGPDMYQVNEWAEDNPKEAEEYIVSELGDEGKVYIEEWKEDDDGMGLPEYVADRSYQPEIFSSPTFMSEHFSDYYIERQTKYNAELGFTAVEQFTTSGDYGIRGAPNVGYNLYRYDEDGSETLVEAGISSVNEAQVRARSENSSTQPDELQARWESYIEDGNYSNYREYLINLPNNPGLFTNRQHFNHINNLAFLRVTDRMVNGKNAFFIEELQSDWHQEGRQEGYRDSELMSQSLRLEDEARTRSTVLMGDSDSAKGELINAMAQGRDLSPDDRITVSMNMEDAARRLLTGGNLNNAGTNFVAQKVIGAAKSDEDFNDVLYFLVDGKRNQEAVWNQYGPAIEKYLGAMVDYENSRVDIARYGSVAKQESRKTPDAPFKDDRWINLAAKKAVMEASKRDDVNAISWPTGESMEARWSDEYAELYNNTYDKKMPAIFGRLTGNKPYKSDWDTAISNYQNNRRMGDYGDISPESSIERDDKYIVAVVRRNGTRRSGGITPNAPDIIPFFPYVVMDSYRASDEIRKNFEQLSKANQNYVMEEGLNNLLNITFSDYFYGTGEEIVERFPDSFQLSERWMVDLPQETKDRINEEGQPLFRAGEGATTTVEDVQAAVAGTFDGLGDAVNVIASQEDLPDNVRQEMKRQKVDRVAGYFDRENQQVYLVADGIRNRRDAQVTLLHEAVGHMGIERVMGKEMGAFLFQVRNARNTDQTVAEAFRWVEENYPGASPAVAASEVVARIAESDPKASFTQRIMQWLRGALRRLGMNVQFSNADIVEALRRARIAVERGEGRAPDARGILFSTGSQPGKKQSLKMSSKSRQEWRDENRTSQRMANTPEQQGLAQALQAGVINNEEYNRATREQSPITPFDSVPKPATVEQMMGALDENKTAKVQPDGMGIPEGTMIGSRLDIPAYNDFNVWVVTAHDGKTAGGKAVAYLPTAVLKNVTFSSSPKGALNVATGKTAKAPFARMRGEWSQHMPDNARRRAQLAMKNDKWVQVGMNPYRHSYFYDKANARPVVGAEEVIQVGALVMAKNPTYADPMDERFQVPGSSFLFEPGAAYQNSESLESWMGDSQIRNPDGTAKVLYHRTSNSFDTFKAFADGPSGAAIFLGDDPDNLPNAHNRRDEGDNIMPVFVRMENPLYLDEFNYQEMKDRYAAKGNGDFPMIISEATKYNLMSKGFDGIIAEDIFGIGNEKAGKDGKEKQWRGSNEYVVFDNSQIKSATGNPGIFGPSSNILFRASDSDGFTVPDETLTGAFIRRVQDKFRPLKDLQAAISEQGGVVNEGNDVYLAEEAFHGKAENDLRLMRTQYVEPMIEKLTGYGLTRKELDQYLYAKHAPERNAHIAKINDAMPDGGSGMTNREAAEILARFRQQGKLEKLEEVAHYVYKMTEAQRQHILKGGLEDDGTVAAWQASYKHYVPLKGWAEDTKDQGIPRTGTGFNIRGQESRRAMGRASEAASPTAYAITDLTEKIVRSRKNQVGNALLKLVQDNPNPDYWRVYTDDDPVIERRIVKERDPETGEMVEKVRDRKARMASLGNDYFITKVGGKPYYIELQDPRLMGAMKNVGPETNGAIIRTMASINRVLSALNTSYAPEFMVSNFARDVQTAILNLQAEQSLGEKGKADGAAISAQTVRDIPVSMRAIYNSLWNRKARGEKAQQWQKWFDEFRADGAKTGYFDMKPIEEQVNDIERMVTMFSGGTKGNLMKLAKNAADVVEHMNSAVENAVRLSAYVNARRAGISRKQAASLAKNMTVNFNRRGEVGTLLNSMYMFANASIQGTANFARTMLTFKGDGSPRWKNMSNAQKIGAGLVMGAYMMATFNRYSAGDDDDGVNFYDKVPAWVKERNLILMKSAFGGERGEYWKIPLPYGYNVFAVMGTSMEGAFAGNKSALDGAADMAIAMAGSFSPLGFTRSEAMPVLGTVGKMVTPTVLAPLPDLYLNENFFGSSIYTKNFPFGTPKPDSSLGRRSTPGQYKALSAWLNELSGGSQWRSGKVDINPDILAYIAESYSGSAGDFFGNRIPDQVMRAIEGVESEQFQMPFIRRISGKVMFYEDQDIFYRRRDEVGQAVNEMKALQGEDRAAFMREYGTTVQMQGKAKATAKRLSGIRKRRNQVYGNESLSARERDQQIKALNQESKSAIDAFNRDWNERVLGK